MLRYVTTNVRLDPEDYRDLQTEARAKGISLAEALRRVLREHVAAWRGEAPAEAREEPAAYGATQGLDGGDAGPRLALGRIRDGQLLVPAPPGTPEGAPVLVNILGPLTEAHIASIRRHQRTLDALVRELAEIPDESRSPSRDDGDAYR